MGRDTIVQPGSKDAPITVFCVEHGRWTGTNHFDQSAPTAASPEIRASAQNGEFYAAREAAGVTSSVSPNETAATGRIHSRGNVQSARRASRVGEAQQLVWDSVAKKNADLKTESNTGSYRTALNLAGGDAQKSVPTFIAALAGSLGTNPHLVGVVAAINGKVVAADIFSDPILFRKLWPKLLRSYASDAVQHTPMDSKGVTAVTATRAKEFLIAATDAKSKIENKSDISSTVRYESSQAVTYSLVPNAKAGSPVSGAFGGGALHTGVLGK